MIGRTTRVLTRLGPRLVNLTPVGLTLAAVLLWRGATPALADFYDLEGRYQCLEKPGAVCYDATPITPTPPPPPQESPPVPVTEAPAAAPLRKGKPQPPPKPVDPLDLIAARVQSGKLAPDDLATLRAHAKKSELRAIEMLAWCAFTGIGGSRDPVQAYVLYGEAADAGSPSARKNQIAIFKGSLTLEQRQRVLDIENSRAKPGG
jgi:hypothetical protein